MSERERAIEADSFFSSPWETRQLMDRHIQQKKGGGGRAENGFNSELLVNSLEDQNTSETQKNLLSIDSTNTHTNVAQINKNVCLIFSANKR